MKCKCQLSRGCAWCNLATKLYVLHLILSRKLIVDALWQFYALLLCLCGGGCSLARNTTDQFKKPTTTYYVYSN
jgi:hypothetical protein